MRNLDYFMIDTQKALFHSSLRKTVFHGPAQWNAMLHSCAYQLVCHRIQIDFWKKISADKLYDMSFKIKNGMSSCNDGNALK